MKREPTHLLIPQNKFVTKKGRRQSTRRGNSGRSDHSASYLIDFYRPAGKFFEQACRFRRARHDRLRKYMEKWFGQPLPCHFMSYRGHHIAQALEVFGVRVCELVPIAHAHMHREMQRTRIVEAVWRLVVPVPESSITE